MTILHFGLYNTREPQQALRDALKGICTKYIEFSWATHRRLGNVLIHLLSKHKPDVVFMQVQTPGIVFGKTLSQYPGIKFFNFSGDVRPEIPEWYFDVAPYCTTLFSNTDWVKVMTDKGFKARYCQIGFNNKIYTPEGAKEITKPVVFMGNNHGSKFPLSKLREDMVKRFSGKEWFQVFGRGWPGAIDLNYKQQREAAVYRGAKIGINLSHMDLGSYSSDRMFRLMGSGCMCLAYRHKDIEKEFGDAGTIAAWSTLDELEELIEHYLNATVAGEYHRTRIAQAGCKLIHEKYTWPYRLQADLIPLL